MANIKAAQKAIRKIARRTEVNKARRSRIKTFLRSVEEAIAAGDQKKAQEAFKVAQSEIMRGVSKGLSHKNTASRKISRLSKQIKALNA